ncbi:hypothetical protein MAA_11730 [Metarhizium robertsii ARSEF 23]|uniref:Uncharacterized protein n=1 Tax=Metarhizium robertsii (strain ARSEF 23 / ATCC MYA-3075) TaxID=655844 RepID=A0A0B2XF85_METRA|nr:uncharacterized protein MAA_11730 [Metarhizium robertsii ARSEF 23]KHO10679.1 hypothetical protein MAA_11730 [Metarhizium robertsii ARSEF 23]
MPRRAIPAEQKENVARLREKYKNDPYVQVAGDRTTRPNVASDLHSRASHQYQSMQKLERHTERAHVAQQVGDTRAVSISSTTPGASTPPTQLPPPPPAPSQLLVSRTTEKGVRDPAAEDVEECRTPSNQSNMLYPAVSVDQTGKPSVEDTRAHRERILRESMAQEATERERNPIINNATSSALEAPIISGAVTSRLITDLTFRPRPQIEQTQQERHGKSPTKVPPAPAVEHAEAANPIAAPATSEVGRIDRPCNSGRRLQDTLEHATRLEADRAQRRRERELDQLLRASKTRTKSNQVKDSSQQPSIRRQDASQRSHFATKPAAKPATSRTGAHTAANNATRSELRVELPVRRVQENNETMEDVIAVTANRPRQATAVTISSTSSRETTSTTATERAEFLTPRPPQSPPPVWKATDAYSSSSASQSEEGSNRRSGNASEVTETPSPSLPTEARPQTPSSMDKDEDEDEDEESLASPSRKLPQHHHISPISGFHESRTTSRDRAKIRARESSILDIEALNIRDKSSLASTTSEESVGDRSLIPAGEADSDYRPSSPIPIAGEESEASTIGAFGPDSGPATPASSRHTSDLFSPSDPTVSHMSMLSSPGMSSASSPSKSDGNSTPTSRPRPGGSHRVLDRYLGANFDQETRGGADFLAKQGKVYQQVIRTFFDIKCDCKFVGITGQFLLLRFYSV